MLAGPRWGSLGGSATGGYIQPPILSPRVTLGARQHRWGLLLVLSPPPVNLLRDGVCCGGVHCPSPLLPACISDQSSPTPDSTRKVRLCRDRRSCSRAEGQSRGAGVRLGGGHWGQEHPCDPTPRSGWLHWEHWLPTPLQPGHLTWPWPHRGGAGPAIPLFCLGSCRIPRDPTSPEVSLGNAASSPFSPARVGFPLLSPSRDGGHQSSPEGQGAVWRRWGYPGLFSACRDGHGT